MIENPQVGQVVRVEPGTVWAREVMRDHEYVIGKVADYRPEGINEVIVVLQEKAWWDYCADPMTSGGHKVNPEHGAYLSREQVTHA